MDLVEKSPVLSNRTFFWRRHPESNRGVEALQAFALPLGHGAEIGAIDEIRTRDIHLGKVALYQLSYYRIGDPDGARTHGL